MLQEREKMLGGILAKMGPQETTPVSSVSFCLTNSIYSSAVAYFCNSEKFN